MKNAREKFFRQVNLESGKCVLHTFQSPLRCGKNTKGSKLARGILTDGYVRDVIPHLIEPGVMPPFCKPKTIKVVCVMGQDSSLTTQACLSAYMRRKRQLTSLHAQQSKIGHPASVFDSRRCLIGAGGCKCKPSVVNGKLR